jgi:adenine/guanine phosphoribosyltransferase-like PRPP-binding protein
MNDEFRPTEGLALAGYFIASGLISMLLAKGLLTPEEAVLVIDDQMSTLKTLGLLAEDRNQAYHILDRSRKAVAAMIEKRATQDAS